MVVAQSQNTSKAAMNRHAEDGQTLQHRYPHLPSPDTCILHLRLLTAFSLLQQEISSPTRALDLRDSVESDVQGRRWTIFVAHAVTRFERWLTLCIRPGRGGRVSLVTCSDPSWLNSFNEDLATFNWTATTAPPLDVLMVLHSYMLNPRDFLQDCLRTGMVDFWRAGFPWRYIETFMSPITFSYEPPEEHRRAYEQATGDRWNPETELSVNTLIKCPECNSSISVPWSQLYLGDVSQMDKGNTEMPFELACPLCQTKVTQSSLCLNRLKKDLILLLEDNVPLPGTLLGNNGQVLQEIADFRSPIAFNEALRTSLTDRSKDLLDERLASDPSRHMAELISRLHSDNEVSGFNGDSSLFAVRLAALRRQASRVDAVYRNNYSSFSLDLVGAVIRQGSFIEKMREFAWIDSPAQQQHVLQAINRYTGFFEVMRKYPNKVAVPTFDVDLAWHTHQLSPMEYYHFSIMCCEGVYIDHNDKIGDNVLSNSFEWTCDAYAEITGEIYDMCLCWCCALLEAEYLSSPAKTTTSEKMKRNLKRFFSRHPGNELSPAEKAVMQIQLSRFEREYARAIENQSQNGGLAASKAEYFETYIWHYPQFAPGPEIACR